MSCKSWVVVTRRSIGLSSWPPILSFSIGCFVACRVPKSASGFGPVTRHEGLPIIMLSERGEEIQAFADFPGKDDFVVKPFSMPELMARVRALLRRSRPDIAGELLTRGDVQLDRETRRVRRGLRNVHSGERNSGCLNVCLSTPAGVFSRRQLLDRVWRQAGGIGGRRIDVHMGRLRKDVVDRSRARSDPQRARDGLCLRRDVRQRSLATSPLYAG